jgi:hypothetical protein
MTDPNPDPQQRAAVDQSADTRDPADDSGMADDPTALAETYPGTFDEEPGQAETAIEAERESEHSPWTPDRSTDNDRDSQI